MHAVATAAALLTLAAATGAGAVELQGAGATFPAPLYNAWIDSYRNARPDVAIRFDAVGSGEGIRRFTAGTVTFGASDAAMTDEQIAKVEGGVVLVPATAGMVAVAYNMPGFTGTLRLGREALAGIFAGAITAWDDPRIVRDNPGATLPHKTIGLVARRDSSGTTFALSNHLDALDGAWRERGRGTGTTVDWPGSAMMVYGNDGVAGRVRISQYSIGYVESGYAERLRLPVAALQNRAGAFVLPEAEAGAAALAAEADAMPPDGRQFLPDPQGAAAYPIVTYSWLLLRRSYPDPAVRDGVTGFVAWGLGEGQALAAKVGYVPLPGPAAKRARDLLGTVR